MPKSDVTVTATFEVLPPDEFTVTFVSDGGTAVNQQIVQKDENATKPENPARTGYTFADWYTSTDDGETLSTTAFEFTTPITENLTLYAKWNIVTYAISYTLNGGEWASDYTATTSFTVEDEFSLPDASAVTRTGYGFGGWYESADGGATLAESATAQIAKGTTGDKSFYAKWTEGAVNYTVRHLQQNITDDDDYTKVASETLSGMTGAQTAAEAKSYEHFTALPFSQKEILADESTVVEIKYDREIVTISFDSDGGSTVADISGKYGAAYEKPANPTKTGYTFSKWDSDLPDTLATLFVKAIWSPNTDTSYTVQHYQENIEDDGYTIVSDDTQALTGTTDEITNASAKSYDGFEAQDFEQEAISPDGSTVIKVYYNRKIITLTFSAGGEAWGDGTTADKTVSGKYGATVATPAIPTKTGYGSSWDKTVQSVFTSDETYTAQYTEGQVNYTVRHLQQNANDDGYSEVTSETLSGTTGTQTTAVAKTYEHFTAQSFAQQAISAEGDTVIEIKYDRETVAIRFDSDGGSAVADISGKYGATYTKPANPTRTGYTFSRWDSDLPDTLVNLSVTAVWLPNTDTPYKVYHYQQPTTGSTNLSDYEYVESQTQTMTGITGELTAAVAYTWSAFTSHPITQQTIAADGSTIVKLYYDRKTYTYTFNANGGKWEDGETEKSITGFYRARVNKLENPSRIGYSFVDWDESVPPLFANSAGKFLPGDKTFKAVWTANTLSPTVTLESVSTDAALTISQSGGTLTATSGFANYRWKLDGTTAQNGTANTYTPDTSALSAGYHNITLAVTDTDGVIWSETAVITVRK